jgi:Cyclic nucleotide-binding domain
MAVSARTRCPDEAQHHSRVVRLEPKAEEVDGLDFEAGLLAHLAAQPVERQLVFAQEPSRQIPQALPRIERAAAEQHTAVVADADGFDTGHGIRVRDVAARATFGALVGRVDSLAADGTETPAVQSSHEVDDMSPRAAGATQHELSRIGLLATLPGETLARLAGRMAREDIAAGAGVFSEGDEGDRFYVVLNGILSVAQQSRGPQGVLRPGDYFGEVALAMHMPRTASVRALTPATVASCDKETFDEFIRPLFADDDA